MPQTYDVEVVRVSYATRRIPVEANSQEEADAKALENAGDYAFTDHESEYKLPKDVG